MARLRDPYDRMCAAIGRISMHLGTKSTRTLSAIGSIGVLLLSGANFAAFAADAEKLPPIKIAVLDRKSTRLNSSHSQISYAVFCLKKKKKQEDSLDISQR